MSFPFITHLGFNEDHEDESKAIDEISHVADHMVQIIQ
jgi:hypothetical protein